MRTRLLLSLLTLFVPACSGEEDAGPTGPFTVTPSHLWASQSVQVSGGGLDPGAGDAWLQIDTLHLPLASGPAGVLSATLPPWLNGSFSPVLHAGVHSFPLDAITVYGYVDAVTYDIGVWGPPQIWRGAGVASLLGSAYPGGVAIFDLDNRTSRRLTGLNRHGEINRQPGPTPDPSVWVFTSDTASNLEGWRLEPTSQRVAEYPVSGFRNVMRFDEDRWWRSSHHYLHLPDGTLEQAEEAQIGFFSPRGDRATLLVNLMGSGNPTVPVYDVHTGDVSWRVPVRRATAGAFSPDGEYLAMAGSDQYDAGTRVMLFRAGDGTVVLDSTFTESIGAVAFDPVRPVIYLAAAVPDSGSYTHPEILVVSPTSLTPVARLVPRTPAASGFYCCDAGTMVTSAVTDRLHMVWANNGPVIDWIFALPPR